VALLWLLLLHEPPDEGVHEGLYIRVLVYIRVYGGFYLDGECTQALLGAQRSSVDTRRRRRALALAAKRKASTQLMHFFVLHFFVRNFVVLHFFPE